jgi:hypothetical protein
MNGAISRLAVFALALIGALILATDVLAGVGGAGARRPAGERDPARCAVHDRAREDLRARRKDAVRDEQGADGERADALLPPLPDRGLAAHVVGYSTQVRSRAGPRAVDERLPHRARTRT